VDKAMKKKEQQIWKL